jgi:nitrate reductase beta subunit
MVWYIPPLSPIQSALENGLIGENGIIPDVKDLRIPIRYLANLLTAGKEEPVVKALETMVAMRRYMRKKSVDKVSDASTLKGTHLKPLQVEEMYRVMAIANYEDRFVIPSTHKEMVENTFDDKASCGFSFGNGCSSGATEHSLFGKKKATPIVFHDLRRDRKANASQ